MLRRARTIEELSVRLARFTSPAGLERARSFRPRRDDVIVATFPKSGTTWMQQIAHGLRSHGDMDFEEIAQVAPWIELAHDAGWDLEADQRARPRVFKSHWNADQLPAGGRAIAVVRDPVDTFVSFYHFMRGWFFEPDAISIDEFAHYLVEREHHAGDYWSHLLTWWRRRDDPSLFLTTYERLKHDHAGEVRRVAEFIGLGHDERAIEIATRQSTFAFMKAHEHQFDDHLLARARNVACGIPEDARPTKIRVGASGADASPLEPATSRLLEQRWEQQVRPVTGHRSYAELCRDLVPR